MPRLVIAVQFVCSVYKHAILSGDGLMMVLLEQTCDLGRGQDLAMDRSRWVMVELHSGKRCLCIYYD